jgi:CubicO group peptidase (beta-lactamase class C family)
MALLPQDVECVLHTIPHLYTGPGGAIAVLKDGELVHKYVWGYADTDQRIPMSSRTILPICSITKQMVCALLPDLERNPTPAMAGKGDIMMQLSAMLSELLPPEILRDSGLTIDNLCDNQSGIRDYWALCMLCGARPDSKFSLDVDARPMLRRLKSLHFEPGTEFSYANTNFHILGRLLEAVTNESLGDLLVQRVFGPARMTSAQLCPDSAKQPGNCVGYEGDVQHGFSPASNFIEWSGDAGIVATLEDMIAYEKYFDSRWSDPQSGYPTVAEARTFKNGDSAGYRYGLGHGKPHDIATVGHGGALRGYRLHRVYAKKERLSVVVMFNHEADAADAAYRILFRLLNIPEPEILSIEPNAAWFGTFFDQDTQLAIVISPVGKGKISITYAGEPETVALVDAENAQSQDMIAKIHGDSVQIRRLQDHRVLEATRISKEGSVPDVTSLHGRYFCEELESTFHCEGKGDVLYGAFDGYLGSGPANIMKHRGEDIWALACPRGVDAPAPGDWTLVFRRDEHRVATSVTIGCWLARRLEFRRL